MIRILCTVVAGLSLSIAAAYAGPEHDEIPEKAVCSTCAARGAGHGDEKVVARRAYEGVHYYFCSEGCAEAFDGFPAAYVPHPLPRPAPDVTVTTLAGEELSLDDFDGKVVLLDFWATWCKPCVKAMPKLARLHEAWASDGFTVIGVSIDEKGADVVEPFVEKKKIRYPVALDSAERPAWHAFHVAAIPAMFLIDEDRQIVAEWKGKIDVDEVRESIQRRLRPGDAGRGD